MRPSYRVGCFDLWKLDAQHRPGLTVAEFHKLFTLCRCQMVMTRRAFRRHYCKFRIVDLTKGNGSEPEIIDLTTKDSDEEMSDDDDAEVVALD